MRRLIKNKKIFLLFFLFGIFAIASEVFALEMNWPRSPAGTELTDESTLTIMVKYFYEWGIALGGLAAFISLVIAGFQYLTSVGDPAKMKDATSRIRSALFGLVLLFASYLILNVINPELTILRIPTVEVPTQTLRAFDAGQPNLSQSCSKVCVYAQPNYNPPPLTEVNKGSSSSISLSKSSPASIEVVEVNEECGGKEGFCPVELYDNSSCSGSPMATLYSSSPDIGALYLKNDIRCIRVK